MVLDAPLPCCGRRQRANGPQGLVPWTSKLREVTVEEAATGLQPCGAQTTQSGPCPPPAHTCFHQTEETHLLVFLINQ